MSYKPGSQEWLEETICDCGAGHGSGEAHEGACAWPKVEKFVTTRTSDVLVNKFLRWPLPDSVCSDLCATKQGYPHRSGTNLLTALEARQMIEYLLSDVDG